MKSRLEDHRVEITSRYVAGESSLSIGAAFGASDSAVLHRLQAWGVPRRRLQDYHADLATRLEIYSIPEPNSGCWLWIAAIDEDGYGKLTYQGRRQGAHRLSYREYRGPIPNGLLVCHTCDVRSCINPDHLFLGTVQDNSDDMVRKGRNVGGVRGEANHRRAFAERAALLLDDLFVHAGRTEPLSYSVVLAMLARNGMISEAGLGAAFRRAAERGAALPWPTLKSLLRAAEVEAPMELAQSRNAYAHEPRMFDRARPPELWRRGLR